MGEEIGILCLALVRTMRSGMVVSMPSHASLLDTFPANYRISHQAIGKGNCIMGLNCQQTAR